MKPRAEVTPVHFTSKKPLLFFYLANNNFCFVDIRAEVPSRSFILQMRLCASWMLYVSVTSDCVALRVSLSSMGPHSHQNKALTPPSGIRGSSLSDETFFPDSSLTSHLLVLYALANLG